VLPFADPKRDQTKGNSKGAHPRSTPDRTLSAAHGRHRQVAQRVVPNSAAPQAGESSEAQEAQSSEGPAEECNALEGHYNAEPA
jgi:hypothetical protein